MATATNGDFELESDYFDPTINIGICEPTERQGAFLEEQWNAGLAFAKFLISLDEEELPLLLIAKCLHDKKDFSQMTLKIMYLWQKVKTDLNKFEFVDLDKTKSGAYNNLAMASKELHEKKQIIEYIIAKCCLTYSKVYDVDDWKYHHTLGELINNQMYHL